MDAPEWLWNEMQQVGTDYADMAAVEEYDQRMASFRDVDAENRSILERLSLPPRAAVLEVGCGTGRFTRAAAGAGHTVTAVDVSSAMLQYAARMAQEAGLPRIEFQHAGFLTMDLPGDHFEAAVSAACLHHLPDVWKLLALENVQHSLKPGGQFILGDVVFPISPGGAAGRFEQFIHSFPAAMHATATGHVATEYSTLDWIMQGLLQRAGLQVLSAEEVRPSFMAYHCRKPR